MKEQIETTGLGSFALKGIEKWEIMMEAEWDRVFVGVLSQAVQACVRWRECWGRGKSRWCRQERCWLGGGPPAGERAGAAVHGGSVGPGFSGVESVWLWSSPQPRPAPRYRHRAGKGFEAEGRTRLLRDTRA